MFYTSTRDKSIRVTAAQAIAQGISEEGGLFVPCEMPQFDLDKIGSMVSMPYTERAKTVLKEFLTDFSEEELDYCVNGAYDEEKFSSYKIAPTVNVNGNENILELWHGPTCAFKDMALQLLPYLMTVSAKKTAQGKTKDEAVMLLNHKDALDFVLDNPDYLKELSTRRIEDIHAILTKELGVGGGIRTRRVGITGTNYRPLDNEAQIREALEDSCALINSKENIFEKALLALVLLSYIQAFSDGNKRTARITSNAILMAWGYCPLSFRTVDSVDYKKAMLMFYEQNNIAAFKQIFIEQYEFATKNYF